MQQIQRTVSDRPTKLSAQGKAQVFQENRIHCHLVDHKLSFQTEANTGSQRFNGRSGHWFLLENFQIPKKLKGLIETEKQLPRILHLGLLCSVLTLLLSREPLPVSALTTRQIPAWAYFGGVVGVLFVVLSNLTAPKISAFSMTLLIFVGQIATGIAIDVFVHQQRSLGKIAGGVLILVGLLGSLSIDEDRKRERS